MRGAASGWRRSVRAGAGAGAGRRGGAASSQPRPAPPPSAPLLLTPLEAEAFSARGCRALFPPTGLAHQGRREEGGGRGRGEGKEERVLCVCG